MHGCVGSGYREWVSLGQSDEAADILDIGMCFLAGQTLALLNAGIERQHSETVAEHAPCRIYASRTADIDEGEPVDT